MIEIEIKNINIMIQGHYKKTCKKNDFKKNKDYKYY